MFYSLSSSKVFSSPALLLFFPLIVLNSHFLPLSHAHPHFSRFSLFHSNFLPFSLYYATFLLFFSLSYSHLLARYLFFSFSYFPYLILFIRLSNIFPVTSHLSFFYTLLFLHSLIFPFLFLYLSFHILIFCLFVKGEFLLCREQTIFFPPPTFTKDGARLWYDVFYVLK